MSRKIFNYKKIGEIDFTINVLMLCHLVLLSAREFDEGISGKVIAGLCGGFHRNQQKIYFL